MVDIEKVLSYFISWFYIDLTKAVSLAYKHLQKVEVKLERENARFALRTLENSKDIIFALQDEKLSLEYELLECCF